MRKAGGLLGCAVLRRRNVTFFRELQFTSPLFRHYTQERCPIHIAAGGPQFMPNGTLDLMKIDGQPTTYQIMFEQNAGGTFVARVESDELVPFLHEEMRVELPTAESAAQRLQKESRVRLQNVFLEENNLHAVMDYMEEDIS
jgi:hypothetical protein